jgi:hypothetical protein
LIGELLIPDGLNVYLVPIHGKTRYGGLGFGFNQFPLWGPGGIAYEQDDGDRYSPPTFSEISLANRIHGSHRVLLRSSPGLLPTSWSRDGSRLLVAQVAGNNLRPLLVDTATDQQRMLPVAFSSPTRYATLSISKDGQRVIGEMNGNVVAETIDGTLQLLAKDATTPSWTM